MLLAQLFSIVFLSGQQLGRQPSIHLSVGVPKQRHRLKIPKCPLKFLSDLGSSLCVYIRGCQWLRFGSNAEIACSLRCWQVKMLKSECICLHSCHPCKPGCKKIPKTVIISYARPKYMYWNGQETKHIAQVVTPSCQIQVQTRVLSLSTSQVHLHCMDSLHISAFTLQILQVLLFGLLLKATRCSFHRSKRRKCSWSCPEVFMASAKSRKSVPAYKVDKACTFGY